MSSAPGTWARTRLLPVSGRRTTFANLPGGLLTAVVVLAPLPLGSVDARFTLVWALALAVALALSNPAALTRPQAALLLVPATACGALLTVVTLQTLSPSGLFHLVGAEEARALLPSQSLAHDQPWFSIGPALANLLAASVAIVGLNGAPDARRFVRHLAWAGTAYCLLALLLQAIDPTATLWRERYAHTSNLVGTFTNRNTAATFFGIIALLWLATLCRSLARSASGDCEAADGGPNRLLWLTLATLLSFIALFLTASRSGIASAVVCCAIATAVYAYRYRDRLSRRLVLGATLGSLLVCAIFSGAVLTRFQGEGVVDPARLATYRSTLQMIADRPWLGVGWGNFEEAFPTYRGEDVTMWGTWDRAHSTPLEIAAEAGLPFAAGAIVLWICTMVLIGRGMFVRTDPFLPVVGFCTILMATLHSLIDYSFQIPGLSIMVFALGGVAAAQSRQAAPRSGSSG